MRKVELNDVAPNAVSMHFNMTVLKLKGGDETGSTKFWMNLSHFLQRDRKYFICWMGSCLCLHRLHAGNARENLYR